ncbi:MAG: sigma-54-dependent Fis family transcriptional regulator [Nitrospirae bacterium]|nr:sigma-54-dependent Fis family transcriptional regulator [Nitrospirota bacterium]
MTSTLQRPILIVDDDPGMRATLTLSLRQMGHAVVAAANGEEALAQIEQCPVGAVVTDMTMPGMSGMDLFRTIKQRRPGIPVIFISAFGSIEVAVDAMKAGGFDYLAKPFSPEALTCVVCRALQTGTPLECALPAAGTGAILTRDPGMLKMLKMAQTVAASQATILIEGESGTGKELLARFIYERSPRAHRPFIAINCAAVPEGLMESELFGYEKGAFTGAVAKKPGRFELAHTGTLLLDEIGELPLSLQAKLLRVLQEREVDVLGGRKPVALDVRVIASTNRSLWDEVKAGRFREDLYYRLNVFPLRLPPLRHRPCDIPLLVEHFIQQGAVEHRQPALTVTPDAMAILMGREWRGNIRELQNVVERAVLLAEHGTITADHLLVPDRVNARPLSAFSTGTTVWEAERSLIVETLERVGGNRTHAARILGISIRTLRNKLRLYRGLAPSDDAFRHDALLPDAAGETADADQLWLPRVVGG